MAQNILDYKRLNSNNFDSLWCLCFIESIFFRMVNKVVLHADKLDDVVSELRQVGGRHGQTGYNIPGGYFPVKNNQ